MESNREHKGVIVFTTINDPVVVESYFNNLKKYDRVNQAEIIIIPDKKTPKAAFERCREFSKQGLNIKVPTLQEQISFLKKIGFPPELIPYNSDNRRNVGYLMALDEDADFIVSIDDDNYCRSETDYFGSHQIVCKDSTKGYSLKSENSWFNICELIEIDSPKAIYPRGFPYFARDKLASNSMILENKRVDINAGLWLSHPDVDGISWLVNPAHSLSFKNRSIILDKNSWAPINTQNTSLKRGVIGSYYFVKMGYPLKGFSIDRYGDIFSGYFSQLCVKHMGGSIRFGTPIVDHKRNSHNYINDALHEWGGILVLEDLLPWLTKEVKLDGNNYSDSYISLSYGLEDFVEEIRGKIWDDNTRAYFHQMAYHMRKWAKVCKKII